MRQADHLQLLLSLADVPLYFPPMLQIEPPPGQYGSNTPVKESLWPSEPFQVPNLRNGPIS